MKHASHFLTEAGTWLARPAAFLVVGAYTALWLILDHETFDWHGVLTLVTLCMTLFIQRSEHRDMQAMQAKLDELLRSHGQARNELQSIDDKEPEEVEAFRMRQ
jgi:low affinity Fe/Cu permease